MTTNQKTLLDNSGRSNIDGDSKGNKKKILDPPTIESVAQLIKTGKAKRIIVMAGAGISTAAGIPDFRTPGTGLYDNLQKYNLPYPEAIFDMTYFKENPEPFFSLAKELFPGNFMPTLTHYFLTLLYRKNILLRCFTQNIDTLERLAGLPDEMIVEAHGSFAKSKCLKCKKFADAAWMKEVVNKGEVPICTSCRVGIVKPCITFFGEAMPSKFFLRLGDFQVCDLLIVIGTSLQVQPFASLVDSVGEKVPRLLINLEKVGDIELSDMGFDFEGRHQNYMRDAFYKGTCDEGVRKLAELCGFKDELLKVYEEGQESLIKEFGKIPTSVEIATKVEKKIKAELELTVDEIDQLAKIFEEKIKIKSEISEEVDQMLKEFDELKEKKSKDKELLKEKGNENKSNDKDDKDDKELLNVKEDITKSDKKEEEKGEKEELKDTNFVMI
ncbi:uncharacterized protein OCT59_005549 [Rhizophagus irregularis]|uniref:protein acetyllysine N-acetyltransferase n=2 Tax=Rhizophagus irregularis TaxID=588596 RepID=A0A015KD97_RHIIW|nr:hypothetical protein GLOIN_2v1687416 [Rhizophagus irregularis DAOM 181602=DAOM 197198]EXX77550.1 Hst2p [Rhizophagus irregularis DAOM 197198w]POG63342.1 hypothetical protein GLOIN_2v1687416 [Rhizophagus irregularis DAOM 181602=DAOM 197198]UZO14079.1 hypothetical protein OCT59_005549 [Rhizophagus irregularis]|eukprot:XP_025170208.1 hypothetical protein GLOIN_2v1687416 [Rhizophagus irregularis DAOM 181602=DAOM 197198]